MLYLSRLRRLRGYGGLGLSLRRKDKPIFQDVKASNGSRHGLSPALFPLLSAPAERLKKYRSFVQIRNRQTMWFRL